MQIVTSNVNGLLKRKLEFENFLSAETMDVELISETHLTPNTSLKIQKYAIYRSDHLSGNCKGGAAVIVKNQFNQYKTPGWKINEFQTTAVNVVFEGLKIIFGVVYSLP